MADDQAYPLRVAGEDFICFACKRGQRFIPREIRLNTGGMTLMGLDWLNKAADGAICERCGYVHSFLGENHQWGRATQKPARSEQSTRPGGKPRRSAGKRRE